MMKPALLTLLLACSTAWAQPAAPVTVEGAWARPAIAQQGSTGAYMTLTAREPLTLVGADTPAAGIVEIHEMRMEGDVMKMRAADKLPLVPGKPLELKPGGFHFMLMDLQGAFKAGSQVRMTLHFVDAKGARKNVAVSVPVAASAPPRR